MINDDKNNPDNYFHQSEHSEIKKNETSSSDSISDYNINRFNEEVVQTNRDDGKTEYGSIHNKIVT